MVFGIWCLSSAEAVWRYAQCLQVSYELPDPKKTLDLGMRRDDGGDFMVASITTAVPAQAEPPTVFNND